MVTGADVREPCPPRAIRAGVGRPQGCGCRWRLPKRGKSHPHRDGPDRITKKPTRTATRGDPDRPEADPVAPSAPRRARAWVSRGYRGRRLPSAHHRVAADGERQGGTRDADDAAGLIAELDDAVVAGAFVVPGAPLALRRIVDEEGRHGLLGGVADPDVHL